jgi:hypothetical protein
MKKLILALLIFVPSHGMSNISTHVFVDVCTTEPDLCDAVKKELEYEKALRGEHNLPVYPRSDLYVDPFGNYQLKPAAEKTLRMFEI